MNKDELQDHKLAISELMKKYKIPISSKKLTHEFDLEVDEELNRPKTNILFTPQYHTQLNLICETMLQPQNILSYISAILLIVAYLINKSEKDHLLVSLFTIFIVFLRTVLIVYEELKINNYYKEKIEHYTSRIIVNKKLEQINKEYLQVGDLIDLCSGDTVGADAVLVSSNNLIIDNSPIDENKSLIRKSTNSTKSSFENSENVVLCGDRVVSGSARAVVTRVGKDTHISKKQKELMHSKSFKSRLHLKMIRIILGCMLLGAFMSIFLVTSAAIYGFQFIKILLLVDSILISFFPEGIPSTIKLLLYSAVTKLENRNVILRDKSAIENLGMATVFVSTRLALISSKIKNCDYIYDGNLLVDVALAFYDRDNARLKLVENIGHLSGLISRNKSHDNLKSYHV